MKLKYTSVIVLKQSSVTAFVLNVYKNYMMISELNGFKIYLSQSLCISRKDASSGLVLPSFISYT